MLDRMTCGLYGSTPHRVLNTAGRDRLSFHFFFDPNFDAEVQPIAELANRATADDRDQRWNRASVPEFRGTYYLLGKVAKVFPQLRQEVLQQRKPLAGPVRLGSALGISWIPPQASPDRSASPVASVASPSKS